MTPRRSDRRLNKGVAIVEMVVVLPLLLFMLFATAELGRAFMQYNTLTKSVRDSVRFLAESAILGQTQTINISPTLRLQTQNLVVYGTISAGTLNPLLPGLAPGNIQVTATSTEDVSVTATYAYQPINPVISKFGLGTNSSALFTFQAQATMRAL